MPGSFSQILSAGFFIILVIDRQEQLPYVSPSFYQAHHDGWYAAEEGIVLC